MIKHFINLQWKQFFRSSYWQKSIVLNILLVFFALYMIVTFLSLGLFLYPGMKEFFPDADPFLKVNGFIFQWLLIDLLMRFFFQKLPMMSAKPLLTLPVKRSSIVNFILGKSSLAFLNFLPLFTTIPFSFQLIKHGYPMDQVITWLVLMFLLSLVINFLNFIIESLSAETELSFLPIILVTGVLYGLNYFGIVSFSALISNGIMAVIETPVLLIVPILLIAVLYIVNFKSLYKKLYIDNSLKTKAEKVKTTNLEWTKRFGDIAPFLQLDLKLITRNKRPRSSIFILVIGLLYGLFFYPNPGLNDNIEVFSIFVGIFVTGIFLINFGQFIPAWDSGYYKLLMSQNIKYEQYLKSKFSLLVYSVVIMFVLSTPYVYFGWKILLAHFAATIYNIGINSHVILFAGSFNRKKIDLNQRAAFNYQGTGAVQWLIGIPLLLLPLLLFFLFYKLINFEAAIIALSLLGVLGIVFHQKLMKSITEKYLESKYKMINAFNQDN